MDEKLKLVTLSSAVRLRDEAIDWGQYTALMWTSWLVAILMGVVALANSFEVIYYHHGGNWSLWSIVVQGTAIIGVALSALTSWYAGKHRSYPHFCRLTSDEIEAMGDALSKECLEASLNACLHGTEAEREAARRAPAILVKMGVRETPRGPHDN